LTQAAQTSSGSGCLLPALRVSGCRTDLAESFIEKKWARLDPVISESLDEPGEASEAGRNGRCKNLTTKRRFALGFLRKNGPLLTSRRWTATRRRSPGHLRRD
jgi:hypothetical protein